MPSVRITNLTDHKINVCLKQLTALHFENEVAPGQTVKFKPGRVWFTVEAVVDDKKNRYSVLKSAATIAVISLAVGAVAVTAGAALLPETIIGGTAVAASTASSSSSLGPAISKAAIGAKSALVSHSGSLAKISAKVLPKAIATLTASLGGINTLQREVLSVLASPRVPPFVRARALHILAGLRRSRADDPEAKMSDKERKAEREAADELERLAKAEETRGKVKEKKASKEVESRAGREEIEVEAEEIEEEIEEEKGVRGKNVVRKHGVFIGERKHIEVRKIGPNLALFDANGKFFL